MTPHEKIAAVYAKLHENRFEHVEQARRARDMQAENDWLYSRWQETEKEREAYSYALRQYHAGHGGDLGDWVNGKSGHY